MHINLRLFFKAEYLALFGTPFRLRRWAYVLFFTGLFWLLWILVAIGRLLDHLLYPGFRRVEIREPIFIIAPPRSGTTLTQKLMSLDEERFSFVRLYQTILPSIFYYRLIKRLAGLDLRLGSPLGRLAAWAEKRFFGGWDDMHKLRFNEPEEDDGFFVYTFVTEAIYLLFPYIRELWGAGFCDDLPAQERRRVMRYYRGCLQRHLYAEGPGKTFLSKATQFSGSIDSILEEFPDARIITIARSPYRSIASHVSVFYPVWQAHSPEIAKDSPESRAYAGLAVAWFRHILEAKGRIDPQRFFWIRFSDLVRDPAATVARIYGHFGMTMSGAFKERLEAAAAREGRFRSLHEYSLEEFGLSKEWILRELDDVFEAYGLDRELERDRGVFRDLPSPAKYSRHQTLQPTPTKGIGDEA